MSVTKQELQTSQLELTALKKDLQGRIESLSEAVATLLSGPDTAATAQQLGAVSEATPACKRPTSS